MNYVEDDSTLTNEIFREKWGPTPQYTCTPGVTSVFHDPDLSEDQYPLKLQYKEVIRRSESICLLSPFRPYECRGTDYTKFLKSSDSKRNVGIGFGVDITFFKEIIDIKKVLQKHHIEAYFACLHTAPQFAGLTSNVKVAFTSSSFLVAIHDVWKKSHEDEELSPCDANKEEIVSNKDLNFLSQFATGVMPVWGNIQPWFKFDKVILLVEIPFHWITLSIDLVESYITIYDSTQGNFDEGDFEERTKTFVPLARILPQVLRYSGFYDARTDVVPNLRQWDIKFPEEGHVYMQAVNSLICGAFALKQADALFIGTMTPFEQKDVKKYRTQVAQTIYHFSTDDATSIPA